jgi:hypothetical protein
MTNVWFNFLLSIGILVAFAPSVNAATESAASNPSAPIWAAVVTGTASMIGLIVSLIYNGRMARKLQSTTAVAEQKQRQRELALKIVDTIAADRTAARRFAIGLVKIERVDYTEEHHKQSDERGKVYFLPVNSRVTVGRDSENDIILHDPNLKIGDQDHNRELSRFHCGFVADQYSVVVEDFASANGTLVSDPDGNKSTNIGGSEVKFAAVRRRQLTDGDRIWVAPFVLRFVKLQENKILQ